MRNTRFLSWAQGFYVAGLVLGLLFIIPSPWFPLQLGKTAIVAACLFIASILFVVGGGARSLLRERSPLLILLGAILPIGYLLSYAFSIDRTVGFSGFAIESDTVLFVILGFLVYVLGIGLFRTLWSVRVLFIGLAGAAAFAAVFQFIVILFGSVVLPSAFSDHSVNLVGKWNDLGLLVGLIPLLLLLSLEFITSLQKRIFASIVAIASVVLLAIINFPLIWSLLLVFSIIVALWSYVTRRPSDSANYVKQVPWVPVIGILVSTLFLLWGAVVNTGLTNIFPVSSLEIRPNLASSLDVVKAAHGSSLERFVFGTGPQTFGQEWLVHKPLSVNQTPFWNLDFNVGYSSFVTALSSVGVLGALAWFMPFILVLIGLVYTLRSSHFGQREKLFVTYLATSSIYLWASLLFYVPSPAILLLAFALSGATLGFVFNKRQVEGVAEHAPSQGMQATIIFASIVLVLLVGWSAESVARRYVAEVYTNQGLIALQQGDVAQAETFSASSLGIEQTSDGLRLGIDAGLARLQQIGAVGTSPTPQQVQDFAAEAQKIIPLGKSALALDPNDYRVYVSLGRVYDYLNSLGVANAYDNAKQMYQVGELLNPTNPQIPLLVARLETVKGNLAGVTSALQQSLTLKPDYTDAILYVVQLDVAQKDIPSAIKAATAAVQSAPGVPSIWFELGLLYYSAGDTKDAIVPLEQALKLQSDYANAKYFLGLSYAAQNRTPDAITQFTDLATSNPDNQEVKLILSNLQAGRNPFTNAQPPVTPTPQNRTTAPISQ